MEKGAYLAAVSHSDNVAGADVVKPPQNIVSFFTGADFPLQHTMIQPASSFDILTNARGSYVSIPAVSG